MATSKQYACPLVPIATDPPRIRKTNALCDVRPPPESGKATWMVANRPDQIANERKAGGSWPRLRFSAIRPDRQRLIPWPPLPFAYIHIEHRHLGRLWPRVRRRTVFGPGACVTFPFGPFVMQNFRRGRQLFAGALLGVTGAPPTPICGYGGHRRGRTSRGCPAVRRRSIGTI